MSTRRKISIRKILQAFVTLVVTGGCLVAVLGASRMQQSKTLNDIRLTIKNENKYQFLDKQTLWNDLIIRKGIAAHRTRFASLDLKSIERTALKNPWVAGAQVYVDNKRNMQIYLTQHVPAARVSFQNGQSYYLDDSLRLLPLSELFTYYTTIVTNVPVTGNDSLDRSIRAQVVKMVRFIERDTFWSAQVSQISLTPDLKFELIPVLGAHRILFGDTTLMKEKFANLFAFYKHVLNRIGWDKYEQLDLRFQDQIVASPSVPWKPQTQNAISNMDWVKSIMAEAPKDSAETMTYTHTAPKTGGALKQPVANNTPKKKAGAVSAPLLPQPVAKKKAPQKSKIIVEKPSAPGRYIYQGNTNR